MPDITMCTGGDCPFKGNCWRATATPTPMRQSWFEAPPFRKGPGVDRAGDEFACCAVDSSVVSCTYYIDDRS